MKRLYLWYLSYVDILFRNSHGLIVTLTVFFGYIGMLLYHYKVSAEEMDADMSQEVSEKKSFQEQFIFLNFLLISILIPFARNHKLR